MPRKLLMYVRDMGCFEELDDRQKRIVRISNTIAAITAGMALILGQVLWFNIGSKEILYGSLIEALTFALVPVLNYFRRTNLAIFTMFFAHCLSALYFGMLFGPVANAHSLFVFLIGAAFFVFPSTVLRISSLAIVIATLVVVELNYQHQIFYSVGLTPTDEGLLRWLIIFAVVVLNVIVIYYYDRENKRYRDGLEKLVVERTLKLTKAKQSMTFFVREVTHEIRTSINVISSIADNSPESGDMVLVRREHMDALKAATQDCADLVNDVLDWSRVEAGMIDELRYKNISPLLWLDDQIIKYQHLANVKGVSIRMPLTTGLPPVIKTDPVKLSRIIGNLLSNAIKFTADHSTVMVSLYIKRQHLILEITDQGKGIPEEKKKDIFRPFYSENQELPATGLGLPITQHLASLLGGTLTVRDGDAGGSVFNVSLPLDRMTEPEEPSERSESIEPLNGLLALVVDDNKMNQIALSMHLHKLGIEAISADSAEGGFSVAVKKQPDVILLDWHMPGKGGAEMLHWLQQNPATARIPVIAVSADAFIDLETEIKQAGASGFVAKPIKIDVLYKELKKAATSMGHLML